MAQPRKQNPIEVTLERCLDNDGSGDGDVDNKCDGHGDSKGHGEGEYLDSEVFINVWMMMADSNSF